jgi:RecA-family ATPase
VIDVLAKFRPVSRGKNNAYEQDYAALSKLQELATRRSITILVVHHTRKGESDDPVEEISGTLGLAGAADAFLVLKKVAAGATLAGRCRDTDDIDLAVQFSGETCRWTILGKASEVHRSDQRSRVLAALEEAMGPMSPKDITIVTGMGRRAVDLLLLRMVRAGEITRIKRGLYSLPKYAPQEPLKD